ncbi:MAG: amidase [Betaproteobacteria bacterium]|nr:amidase [Betaproteobacteria bacterium]
MTTALPLNRISASDAAAAIAAGKLTSEALVAACLERIGQREDDVRAWAYIDPALALEQARRRDRETPKSRLHGIPVGIKDVIDTCDLPTEYGSPIYRGHRPACDAACVAQVRELGGIILGKTVSTEFATRHPGKTRNPRDLGHTPGGSSSGSAAAVADCMLPIAFGTQTSSSTIRPAAFCGVIGYKPTFNLVNRAGLKFLSESLDTIGALTRTIPDAALIVEELSGMPATSFAEVAALKPRIGFCRTPHWNQADAASRANLEHAAETLAAAGAMVRNVDLPAEFSALSETQVTVSSYEFFRALTHERTRFPQLISPGLTARIAAGGKVSRAQYEDGLTLATRCRIQIADVFREYDMLLAPSAPGEAPRGLDNTGDPIFGLMWTLLLLPCLTLPYGKGPAGLPLGVQLIGAHGGDAALFVHAEWARRALIE